MRLNAAPALLVAITVIGLLGRLRGAPLPPDQELATFDFADPNLTADLVVSEPNVVSPVCVTWDADGRMFVAEMTDYPTAKTGGRIRLFEDRDADGQFERITIFADGLPFPTSVLPWKDGVLVSAAPNIWFLRDTNGDGSADERHVLFAGFEEGNQQLRVNGLTWGLDNWVYGANGRSDGDVHPVEVQTGSDWTLIGPALSRTNSLRGRDFRFRPATGQFESIAGRSQFGTTFDDWGNRFLSWNTMPFRHVVIESRYLDCVAHLGGMESSQNLQPPGDDGRIFPLTAAPQVFNNESQTHFNASAGTTVYRGDALSEKYHGNLFVGEPLRNLVHRRVLEKDGATFSARRDEEGREFLASTDPWFHPVNFATGPDGALYVVDFYRQFVEHPGYVPEEMRSKVDWRIGAEHGRVWRIRLKDWKPQSSRPELSRRNSSELVNHLNDSNAWWRIAAQRLLVERQDKSVVPALEKVAHRSPSRLGRLHALYTLDGLDALKSEDVIAAMRDADPSIRRQAVILSEQFVSKNRPTTLHRSAERSGLEKMLYRLRNDRDERVRLQAILTLGMFEPVGVASGTEIGYRWNSTALLCSSVSNPWQVWLTLGERKERWLRDPGPAQADFIEQLAVLVGSSNRERDVLPARRALKQTGKAGFPEFALFNGLVAGVGSDPSSGSDSIARSAKDAAISTSLSFPVRRAAIRVLGKSDRQIAAPALTGLLAGDKDDEVRIAAARALGELNDPDISPSVIGRWADYSRSVRRQLLSSASRSTALALALVDALETGTIPLSEIDPSARQALEKSADVALKERVKRLFQDSVSSDREEVIQRFKDAVETSGDRKKGAVIFARSCLQCHEMQGRGNVVGPNIYSVASQAKPTLLTSILDPSRQVTPDYLSYTITSTDGETITGIITSESGTSVTMRRPNVPDTAIPRNRIKSLSAEGKSLMPDGLEQGLTVHDVADLLEFIRQPDDKLLPPENSN